MGRPRLDQKKHRESITITLPPELIAKARASGNASRFFEVAGRLAHEEGQFSRNVSKQNVMTFEDVVSEFMSGDWKLAAGEIIRHIRHNVSFRGVELPPVGEFKRLALLAAIIMTLADELGISPPLWATSSFRLDEPWFLSGLESMRAIAIVESPPYFRRNGIFVTKEFLMRV